MIALRSKTGIKTIVYTSVGDYLSFLKNILLPHIGGSKGGSKGAVPTHGNLSKQIQQINAWLPEFVRFLQK